MQLAAVLIITFLLFSFIIKSQDPINRLILPTILMWTPMIAYTLFGTEKRVWFIFPLLIWVVSLPWLLNNHYRPLLPNQTRAVANWPSEGTQAYFNLFASG